MTRLLIVLFGGLTLVAGYLTVRDVGVMEPSVQKHSVRTGSAHARRGGILVGGYRSGK